MLLAPGCCKEGFSAGPPLSGHLKEARYAPPGPVDMWLAKPDAWGSVKLHCPWGQLRHGTRVPAEHLSPDGCSSLAHVPRRSGALRHTLLSENLVFVQYGVWNTIKQKTFGCEPECAQLSAIIRLTQRYSRGRNNQ